MKSAVAVLGMAAIANAYSFPRHANYHHQRGNNYTEPITSQAADAGSSTTITIYDTQTRTVTSCAATITNCPAKQSDVDALPADKKSVYYVTDTVVLTETVCPVSDVPKISSSVIEQAQTGAITPKYTVSTPVKTTAPSAPLSTGSPAKSGGDNSGETPNTSLTTIASSYVTDKTLTLTIGTGSNAQVTTTTVRSTVKTTITVPCSQVTGQAGETGKDNSGVTPSKGPDNGESYGKGSSAEPTTTVTGTKTATITLTISKPDTTVTNAAGGDNSGKTYGSATQASTPKSTGGNSSSKGNSDKGSSSGNGSSDNGSCECNGATATVTVTSPASTVYITVGTQATKTGSYSSESTGTGNNSSSDDDEDEDDDEDYCEDDTTTTLQATVTVVPYPVNGTTHTTGYAKPTGFARLVR